MFFRKYIKNEKKDERKRRGEEWKRKRERKKEKMLLQKTADLIQPIESAYHELKCKNDTTLCTLRNKLAEKKLFVDFYDSTNDLFLHAFRKYTNLNTIFIIGKNKEEAYSNFYLPKYKEQYILYGIKTLALSKSDLCKAFYQLLYYRHQKRHIQDFMNDVSAYTHGFETYQRANDDEKIMISILIVSRRTRMYDFYALREEKCADSLTYLPESREAQWIAATLFFNQNSLDFLEKQDLKFYLKAENKSCWDSMNEFLKFLYETVPMEERHRLIFYSSTILYFLGHRANNDFDMMIFCKEEDPTFHQPLRLFELSGNQPYQEKGEKGIYDFSYIYSNQPELSRKYYEEFYDNWAQKYGVRKFEEIYAFGKHHMYFLGMKSTLLNQDVIRRQLRNRPRAIADLIALRKRYGFKLDIPKPPKTMDKFHKVDALSVEEKSSLLQKGGKIISTYGVDEIKIVESVDEDRFLNTVIWALDTRYGMDFTLSEVRVELGLEKKSDAKNTYKIRIAAAKKVEEEPVKKIRVGDLRCDSHDSKSHVRVVKTKDAITGEIVKSKVGGEEKKKEKRKFVLGSSKNSGRKQEVVKN